VEVADPRPHVRLITIDRPERMNALSFDTMVPFVEAVQDVAADEDAWVVVVTGRGEGFCSGLDLEDAGTPPGAEGLTLAPLAVRAMEYTASLVTRLRGLRQTVICAVNGAAIGGGMCLTLGADIRIAGASAYFRNAGINNGLTGTELGISWLLPRAIGASRAFEIILSGRDVDAQEAERIGLVSRVVPDDRLLDECLDLADRINAFSPHGVAQTKKVLWANLETPGLEAAIDLENRNQLLVRLLTENLQEAIRARKEGRQPKYAE